MNTDNHNCYDDEPVFYCSKCYSLSIKHEPAIDADCCMDCGCSDISSAPIEEWEQLYKKRYNHSYVARNSDSKDTIYYKMTLQDLKKVICSCDSWRSIISDFYPRFPGGYGKIDSLILFFDKIMKDNKLDRLRTYLFNNRKIKNNGKERREETHNDSC